MRLLRSFFALLICGLLLLVAGNLCIEISAAGRLHAKLEDVPAAEVGLVLGTSRHLRDGSENPFFAGRISAAAELYRAGKIRHLLLSGDNHLANYDEPADMRAALLAREIPAAAMTVDDAGFRTLDSFARAHEVFGLSRLTIVTDDFHAARAVFWRAILRSTLRPFSRRPCPGNGRPKRACAKSARAPKPRSIFMCSGRSRIFSGRASSSRWTNNCGAFLRARPRAAG